MPATAGAPGGIVVHSTILHCSKASCCTFLREIVPRVRFRRTFGKLALFLLEYWEMHDRSRQLVRVNKVVMKKSMLMMMWKLDELEIQGGQRRS